EFATWQRPAPPTDPIKQVTISLNRFQCLRETDGPLDAVGNIFADHEIEAQLALQANGVLQQVDGRAGTFEDIGPGWIQFVTGQSLRVANPTTPIVMMPSMWEVDDL